MNIGNEHRQKRKGIKAMQDMVFGTVSINGRGDKVRVETSTYKDKQRINIRQYYTDEDGDLKPTSKGIAFPVGNIEAVNDIIEALVLMRDKLYEEEAKQ